MSSLPVLGHAMNRSVTLVADRPGVWHCGPNAVGRMRLPSESIGNFTLVLTNLVAGSAIRIEVAGSGALIEYRVAGSGVESFVIPAYAAGNPSNELRIKVRKGSEAPFYRPFTTQATAFVGSASVFVAQEPDE